MKRLWLLLGILVWAPVAAPVVMAQENFPNENPYAGATHLYAPANTAFGSASGLVTEGLNKDTQFTAPFSAGTPSAIEIDTLQGCGGVGVAEYSNTLFNMPQVFDQFKQRDVNSVLAKELMTYNMTMPQTAALFGQLNTFGNERFQQYKAACSLTAQQQDAKQQYMRACITNILPTITDADVAVAGDVQPPANSSNVTQNSSSVMQRKQVRATEICNQQYGVQTLAIMNQSNQSYAQLLRDAQDVNKMLEPLVCPKIPTTDTTVTQACWPNLLLPQVRICDASRVDASGVPLACDPAGFGIKPAPVRAAALLDSLRSSMSGRLVDERISPFMQALKKLENSRQFNLAALDNAANLAAKRMYIINEAPIPSANVQHYQTTYLNCRDADVLRGLKKLGVAVKETYGNRISPQQQGPTSSGIPLGEVNAEIQAGISPTDFNAEQFKAAAEKFDLPVAGGEATTKEAMVMALAESMNTAAGCTANREVPFLDPQLFVGMRNDCSTDDINGYLAVASYDVATAATRSMLGYTKSQLQEAVGRLESGDPTTIISSTGNTATTVDSPAIRSKLALAIRTIMLPSLNEQLARLDDMQQNRGAFGARAQQMYAKKRGCMSGAVLPAAARANTANTP